MKNYTFVIDQLKTNVASERHGKFNGLPKDAEDSQKEKYKDIWEGTMLRNRWESLYIKFIDFDAYFHFEKMTENWSYAVVDDYHNAYGQKQGTWHYTGDYHFLDKEGNEISRSTGQQEFVIGWGYPKNGYEWQVSRPSTTNIHRLRRDYYGEEEIEEIFDVVQKTYNELVCEASLQPGIFDMRAPASTKT